MASEKLYSIHSVYVMMGRILTYNHLNCFIPMYPYMDKSMQLNPVLHQWKAIFWCHFTHEYHWCVLDLTFLVAGWVLGIETLLCHLDAWPWCFYFGSNSDSKLSISTHWKGWSYQPSSLHFIDNFMIDPVIVILVPNFCEEICFLCIGERRQSSLLFMNILLVCKWYSVFIGLCKWVILIVNYIYC